MRQANASATTKGFGCPIDVLDLGCGTGRYWHHLRNLKSLTGVDVSPDMLRLAQHPVREDAIAERLGLVPSSPNDWGTVFRGPHWKMVGRQKSAVRSNHAREIEVWQWEP